MVVLTYIVVEDILFCLFFLLFSIGIGIIGYRVFANFDWFRSFYNSCYILSGTGNPEEVTTTGGKVFVALYSLYGGVVFLIIFAIIIGRIAAST